MTVNIAGTFRKDERPANGLEAIAEELAKDGLGTYVVVGLVQRTRVVHEDADDSDRIVVKFVAVEPLRDAQDVETAKGLLEKAKRARTGSGLEPTLAEAVS